MSGYHNCPRCGLSAPEGELACEHFIEEEQLKELDEKSNDVNGKIEQFLSRSNLETYESFLKSVEAARQKIIARFGEEHYRKLHSSVKADINKECHRLAQKDPENK